MQMIIAIDFDGTIVDHTYPTVGKPVPNAIEWMKKFQDAGARLILLTMRSDEYLEEAVKYLKDNGIDNLYGINENPDQHTWTNSRKVYANLYIDDAAQGCPLIQYISFNRLCVDWNEFGDEVLAKIGTEYRPKTKTP